MKIRVFKKLVPCRVTMVDGYSVFVAAFQEREGLIYIKHKNSEEFLDPDKISSVAKND